MQPALNYSLVVPIYRNEANIPALLAAIAGLQRELGPSFEAIFVVDGSPDASHERLQQALPGQPFASTLVALARNFGAFAAIRHGLGVARGQRIAVMAADLQEPPALVAELLRKIEAGADVAFGTREGRNDPALSRMLSNAYWSLYRRWVMPEIPRGGVDIFAVSQRVRDALLTLPEANTSLLAQLFWLGGRRAFVPYVRQQREIGRSAWTFRKKLRYLMDSVFAFTDLPIRVLLGLGLVGVSVSAVLALAVLVAKLSGHVAVPGYAATILVVLFFGAFNALGLGIIGSYVWRAFENTKQRPLTIEQQAEAFTPDSSP